MKSENSLNSFILNLNYAKNQDPVAVLKGLAETIEGFRKFDSILIDNLSLDIKTEFVIENIESGSIIAKLITIVKSVPDETLLNLDWKPIIGQYLVEAKYIVIDFLSHKIAINDRSDVDGLKDKLIQSAKPLSNIGLMGIRDLSSMDTLDCLKSISNSTTSLSDSGAELSYSFSGEKETIKFNLEASIDYEALEDLLIDKKIVNIIEMVLKIKKPDYLGESKWEFKHGNTKIIAKVLDLEWLQSFRDRKIPLFPNDSLQAIVEVVSYYDHKNYLLKTDYNISKVLGVDENNESKYL